MFKDNNRNTRTNVNNIVPVSLLFLNIFDTLFVFLLLILNRQMILNLSMRFRVGHRSPVTFKMKLFVTTVNSLYTLANF